MTNNNVPQLNSQNKNRLISGSVGVQIFESGIANTRKVEPIPHYIQTNVESIFSSVGVNASIVVGKDRPGSSLTGHGGVGDSGCSTIDIVAGRSSLYLVEENQSKKLIYTNPNHKADAARIYISEMTDIDDNFELVDGSVGNSKNKSAIAMKADGIRIIARDGIKLVTKTDFANSKGKEILQNSGINIIALNDESTLQPMVLGDNLVNCLTDLIKEVDAIQSRLHDFVVEQQKFNDKVASHTHVSNFPGTPTLPAAETIIQNLQLTFKKLINQDMGIYLQKSNFASIKNKYLLNPKSSIKSNYNKVN